MNVFHLHIKSHYFRAAGFHNLYDSSLFQIIYFRSRFFHIYIYGCLFQGSLIFLRSSICRLPLGFDSSDALGHGGGGSGDGVGLVEVLQNLKGNICSRETLRKLVRHLDRDI